MYENLNEIQKMEDPKARVAKDLERSNKKVRIRKNSSSVSLNTVNNTLTFVKILGFVAIVVVLCYLCYAGLKIYLS